MKAQIIIPENLSEITLGQYQAFLEIAEGLEGDMLAQRTVNILCDVRLSDIMMLRLSDVREISAHLNNLFSLEQELKPIFKIKDVEFGFIPSLEDISFGEYVDLDKYINDWATMHQAMSVLYRPITKNVKGKYEVVDYQGTKEFSDLMRFMPLDVALGALVFFYRLGNELLKATRNYLVEQTQEMISQMSPSLISNGDGTIPSMHSLKETLEHLTQLPDFQLPKHLHI